MHFFISILTYDLYLLEKRLTLKTRRQEIALVYEVRCFLLKSKNAICLFHLTGPKTGKTASLPLLRSWADAEEGMPTAIKHTIIIFLKNHLERE